MTRQFTVSSLAGLCLLSATVLVAQPPAPPSSTPAPQGPAAELLKQGQQKLREGKHQEALAIFREASAKAPAASAASTTARVQAGVALDLMGQYADARAEFTKAIEAAAAPEDKARATRAMAMSYAFERNCDGAAKYEAPLYESYLAAKDFFNAGEIANELARVCLESGSTDQAATWYQRGHEAGLKEPDLKPERRDLWEFRWEHAQARLAARRGQSAEAQKHVAAAKGIFDKGTNPEQAPFVPYLVGYVAFYGGDSQAALTELQKGNQNDPFILSLIAQAYEKLGDKDKAVEYYRKVLASNAHNPTNAFARPLAKQKLGQ
jgi:tetratricopeptide (TPR) repeat protein